MKKISADQYLVAAYGGGLLGAAYGLPGTLIGLIAAPLLVYLLHRFQVRIG